MTMEAMVTMFCICVCVFVLYLFCISVYILSEATHLQVWAGSENDKGGDGHRQEEDQQEQSIDHKSHLD